MLSWGVPAQWEAGPQARRHGTDLVKPDELTRFQDLLDPKWKGKLLIGDVRTGSTYPGMLVLRKALGDDAVRKLLIDQQPVFTRDTRSLAEDVIRGKHPISFNATIANLAAFRREGLTRNVKSMTLPETAYLGAAAALFIFDRAPHPNAALVFVNWLLTQEGVGTHLGRPRFARRQAERRALQPPGLRGGGRERRHLCGRRLRQRPGAPL